MDKAPALSRMSGWPGSQVSLCHGGGKINATILFIYLLSKLTNYELRNKSCPSKIIERNGSHKLISTCSKSKTSHFSFANKHDKK